MVAASATDDYGAASANRADRSVHLRERRYSHVTRRPSVGALYPRRRGRLPPAQYRPRYGPQRLRETRRVVRRYPRRRQQIARHQRSDDGLQKRADDSSVEAGRGCRRATWPRRSSPRRTRSPQRAALRDVQPFENLVVAVVDDAAKDLRGRCELARALCEVALEYGEALDLLDPGEAPLTSSTSACSASRRRSSWAVEVISGSTLRRLASAGASSGSSVSSATR